MMRTRLGAIVLTASVLVGITGWARETNSVQHVSISEQQNVSVVVIHTRTTPTFNVFKLGNPPRIFIDVASMNSGNLPGTMTVDNGVINRISVVKFLSAGQTQTRVVITLVKDVPYTVETKGADILVKLSAIYRHQSVQKLKTEMQNIKTQLDQARAKAEHLSARLNNSNKLAELEKLVKREQERKIALEEAAKKEEQHLKYLEASRKALQQQRSAEKKIASLEMQKKSADNAKMLAELKQLAAQKAKQSKALKGLAARIRQEELESRKKAEQRQKEEAKLKTLVNRGNKALKNFVEAQRKVEALQARMSYIKDKLVSAKADLKRTRAEQTRLSRKVRQLKGQVNSLKQTKGDLQELTKRLEKVSAQTAILRKQLTEKERALKNAPKGRDVQRLKAALAKTRSQYNAKITKLNSTRADHDRLANKVRALQAQVNSLKQTKGNLQELTKRLEKVSAQTAILRKQLSEKERALKNAPKGRDVQRLKAALAKTRSQYDAKITKLNSTRADHDRLANKVRALQAQVNSLKQTKGNLQELTKRLEKVSAQTAILRKKLTEKERALKNAPKGRDVQRLKAALAKTRSQYDAKIAELNRLATQKASEVRRLSMALQKMKATASSQQESLNEFKTRLHDREQEIRVMRKALLRAKTHGKKTRANKQELSDLRKKLSVYESRTRELNKNYKSLLAKGNRIRGMRENRIRELTRQLEVLQKQAARQKSIEIENLRRAIAQKENEIQRLKTSRAGKKDVRVQQNKLNALNKRMRKALVRERDARRKEALAASKVVNLMDKLVKTKGELSAMKETITKNNRRLNYLTQENQKSRQHITELEQRLSQAQNQNQDKVERLHKELKAEQNRRKALEQKQSQALQELRRTRRMMVTRQARAKSMEKSYKARKAMACSVKNIDFKQANGKGVIRLSIHGIPDYTVTRLGPKTLLMTIRKAFVKQDLEKKLDVSAFETPVSTVTTYSDKKGNVKILLEGKVAIRDRLDELSGLIVWDIMPDREGNIMADAGTMGTVPGDYKVPSAVGMVHSTGKSGTQGYMKPFVVPKTKRFRGKRINITVKDADIINVLTFLAKEGHVNIVTTKGVQGKVSFHLENIPWDQALDTILKVNGLDYVVEQGIYRVAPAEKIQAEYQMEIEKRKRAKALKPVMIRLIPVNYTSANLLSNKVKSLLSPRGSVSFDKRTNTLIIKDTEDHLSAIEQLVHKLDMQTPQVLIEARIVEARTTFSRSMGIQWGGKFVMAPGYGNDTGLLFPNTVGIGGGADDTSAPTGGLFNDSPHFAVNLPAPTGMGSGGALGITLGSLGGAANLSLRLSSAEDNGNVKIISAPRISTLDNEKAVISQGVSIPISVVSAAGVNTQFFSADLKLQVTPHVTRDGHILLKIVITKNEPDFGNVAANGNPTIQKKEAQTNLLVNDGDTAVIGGIYTKSTSQSYHKLPFFGDIPILGWLFKTKSSSDNRSELLIFITPKVVNREVNL